MHSQLVAPIDLGPASGPRASSVHHLDPAAPGRLVRLSDLALRGLMAGYDPATGSFAQTVRGVSGGRGVSVVAQGASLRYTAMAALGLGRMPEVAQRAVLDGRTAAEVVLQAAVQAVSSEDPGAVALALWAAVEVADQAPPELLGRIRDHLRSGLPLATVDTSWMLTAAVAAAKHADTTEIVNRAARQLQRYHGPGGTYPHMLPPRSQSRWRAHVGSFADQVYPLQALARAHRLTTEPWMLEYANRTASAICTAQGPGGQWWWHYDSRDGAVVERYPVYSVHQHAMAPMVLFDLWEAGGDDHRAEIVAGLGWIDAHPEVVEELVAERFGLVWRKVGRREPRKAARAIGAATTSVWQGFAVPGVDRVLPPVSVDHECRPYELGWLLYAWHAPLVDDTENRDA